LLENALKYGCSNAEPWIEVRCLVEHKALVLSVSDNGKGIAPQDHHKVFEPFRRLDPEMAEGSGIGLVAARRLISRHGGVISLRSEAGKGATFVIRLPLDPGVPALDGVGREQPLAGALSEP
jgi:signal transduction histidine kinase